MIQTILGYMASVVLYSTAFAFQALPDGEQGQPVVEDPDNLGYFKGEVPLGVSGVASNLTNKGDEPFGFEVPDTFPDEWCYV